MHTNHNKLKVSRKKTDRSQTKIQTVSKLETKSDATRESCDVRGVVLQKRWNTFTLHFPHSTSLESLCSRLGRASLVRVSVLAAPAWRRHRRRRLTPTAPTRHQGPNHLILSLIVVRMTKEWSHADAVIVMVSSHGTGHTDSDTHALLSPRPAATPHITETMPKWRPGDAPF